MKRILLMAAACAAIIGCDKTDDTAIPDSGKGKIIISASVATGDTKVLPDDPTAERVTFTWEAGDTVILKNATGKEVFTIIPESINGAHADFEGTPLTDMSTYDVYNYDPDELDATHELKVQYMENSFRPFAYGTGNNGGFTLDDIFPVLHFGIFSNDDFTLSSITYHWNPNISGVSSYGTIFQVPSIALDESPLDIYLPVCGVGDGFTLSFCLNSTADVYIGETDKTLPDTVNMDLSKSMNKIITFDLPLRFEVHSTCLASGTKITMADGTLKNIEDIVSGDQVRTFDHEAGSVSSSEICLTYKGGSKARPLNLLFASGRTLSIVGTHDLLFEGTRKYVRIDCHNVSAYVGKGFWNAETGIWDELTGYEVGTEPADYYCIYSACHLNCIAEGMLTVPDDVDHSLNIYELDANLKADPAQLAEDITTYGLCDITAEYPEYIKYKDLMEALQCKYVNIALGKGIITKQDIEQMHRYWDNL